MANSSPKKMVKFYHTDWHYPNAFAASLKERMPKISDVARLVRTLKVLNFSMEQA